MTKLHCLGTAGYHPSESRHTSSFFLDTPSILLDAGTSVFRLKSLLRSKSLSILLSHAHLDHVMGLTFFWDLLAPHTPLETIHLYATEAKLKAIQTHLFHPDLFPVIPPFEFHTLEELGTRFQLGSSQCTWFPVEHPGGAIAFRLDMPGGSLGYVTDTTCETGADYWKEVQGVDWLIHECNFTDAPQERQMAIHTGHSWTSAVLSAAKDHGVDRLILTHLNPLAEDRDPIGLEASKRALGTHFPDQIYLAEDGKSFDLSVR
jgi:ribonuclease BN (tRNA processing enzyme)